MVPNSVAPSSGASDEAVSPPLSQEAPEVDRGTGVVEAEAAPGASSDVPLSHIADKLACGVCRGMVAGPLTLSCGHMFCGSCLYESIASQPFCPACQMGLRSIPVRCTAVDALTASLADKLEPAARDAWRARHQGGSSAADKVNKLFWWLAPQAVPFNSNLQGGVSLSFANPGVQAAAAAGMRPAAPHLGAARGMVAAGAAALGLAPAPAAGMAAAGLQPGGASAQNLAAMAGMNGMGLGGAGSGINANGAFAAGLAGMVHGNAAGQAVYGAFGSSGAMGMAAGLAAQRAGLAAVAGGGAAMGAFSGAGMLGHRDSGGATFGAAAPAAYGASAAPQLNAAASAYGAGGVGMAPFLGQLDWSGVLAGGNLMGSSAAAAGGRAGGAGGLGALMGGAANSYGNGYEGYGLDSAAASAVNQAMNQISQLDLLNAGAAPSPQLLQMLQQLYAS